MHIICSAAIENEKQRDNLFDCIKILGGMPMVEGNVVSVEYMGDDMKASKIIALFEEYPDHALVQQK